MNARSFASKNSPRALIAAVLLLWPATAAAQVNIAFERDRMTAVLHQVSRQVANNFYDKGMRGLDWTALTAEARTRIERAESPGAMALAIYALLNQLNDSHTLFIPPAMVNKVRFGFEAKAYGKEIRIYELDEKGPAALAGFRRGDRILTVNGFAAERDSFDLLLLFFRRLNPTTVLNIQYLREGEQPRTLQLQARIEQGQFVEDLTKMDTIYKYIREAENQKEIYRYGMQEGVIGYVALPSFTASDSFLHGLIKRISKARAVVVDLRGNPGGSIETVARVASYFEPEPAVMAQLALRAKTEAVQIKPKKPGVAGPMFVLVDSQSASAAEMFARHFQRTGRAKVVGDQTAGRVTASRIFLEKMGVDRVIFYGIQITVGRIVFPDGQDLEKRGVTPDFPCLPTAADLRANADPCAARAFGLARKAIGLPGNPPEKPGK